MKVYAAEGLTEKGQAYDLLSLAVREQWGLGALPCIQREERGKPFFPDRPERQFNLSHSGSLALCALDGSAVGADIQTVRAFRTGLPSRVLAPQELAWLEEQPDLWRGFALLWALKESRGKYSGEGLLGTGRAIQTISIPLPEGGATLFQLDGLWFRTYEGESWMAAVCGETPPPEEILWRKLPPKENG